MTPQERWEKWWNEERKPQIAGSVAEWCEASSKAAFLAGAASLPQADGWISVEERLPEFSEERCQLGASEHRVLLFVWNTVRQGSAYTYRDGSCVFTVPNVCGEITKDVTHWQPEPAGPLSTLSASQKEKA